MIKNFINSFRFMRALKVRDSDNGLDELIALASEERGVLYKLLQQLYPEQVSSKKSQKQLLSNPRVISLIEKELQIKFDEHFYSLSDSIFAASIGQLHKARLKNGDLVAIKVQYPEVRRTVMNQIKMLKLAALSSKISPIAKWNIEASNHVSQIEKRLHEELDYNHELQNLLKAKQSSRPYKAYCSSKILTQTWIEGIDLDTVLKKWNNDQKKKVANLLVSGFFNQVFELGFIQGDTNVSNFIFQDDRDSVRVHWIDFGNWIEVSPKVQASLYELINKTINPLDHEPINYLAHFERIGFDLDKLKCLENVLPLLLSILIEPMATDRPYNLNSWKMEERIDSLLGENKWWFRSSGNSSFLELMKAFYGAICIVKSLEVDINWQALFTSSISSTKESDFRLENIQLPQYQNTIPQTKNMAKTLVLHILKNSDEPVKMEMPATALLDLENIIPDEFKSKLLGLNYDIKKIKYKYLEKGLVPGEVLKLETGDLESRNELLVYLV